MSEETEKAPHHTLPSHPPVAFSRLPLCFHYIIFRQPFALLKLKTSVFLVCRPVAGSWLITSFGCATTFPSLPPPLCREVSSIPFSLHSVPQFCPPFCPWLLLASVSRSPLLPPYTSKQLFHPLFVFHICFLQPSFKFFSGDFLGIIVSCN